MSGKRAKYNFTGSEQDEYVAPMQSNEQDLYVNVEDEQVVYENTGSPPHIVAKDIHYWEKQPVSDPRQHVYGNVPAKTFTSGTSPEQEVYTSLEPDPVSPSSQSGIVKQMAMRFQPPGDDQSTYQTPRSNESVRRPSSKQSATEPITDKQDTEESQRKVNLYVKEGSKTTKDVGQVYSDVPLLKEKQTVDDIILPLDKDQEAPKRSKKWILCCVLFIVVVVVSVALIITLAVLLAIGSQKNTEDSECMQQNSNFKYASVTVRDVGKGFIKIYGSRRDFDTAKQQCFNWNSKATLIDKKKNDLNGLKNSKLCEPFTKSTPFWVKGEKSQPSLFINDTLDVSSTAAPQTADLCPTSTDSLECEQRLCFVCYLDKRYIPL